MSISYAEKSKEFKTRHRKLRSSGFQSYHVWGDGIIALSFAVSCNPVRADSDERDLEARLDLHSVEPDNKEEITPCLESGHESLSQSGIEENRSEHRLTHGTKLFMIFNKRYSGELSGGQYFLADRREQIEL